MCNHVAHSTAVDAGRAVKSCVSSPAAHSAKTKAQCKRLEAKHAMQTNHIWYLSFPNVRLSGEYIGENAQCPRHPLFPVWSVHLR